MVGNAIGGTDMAAPRCGGGNLSNVGCQQEMRPQPEGQKVAESIKTSRGEALGETEAPRSRFGSLGIADSAVRVQEEVQIKSEGDARTRAPRSRFGNLGIADGALHVRKEMRMEDLAGSSPRGRGSRWEQEDWSR